MHGIPSALLGDFLQFALVASCMRTTGASFGFDAYCTFAVFALETVSHASLAPKGESMLSHKTK